MKTGQRIIHGHLPFSVSCFRFPVFHSPRACQVWRAASGGHVSQGYSQLRGIGWQAHQDTPGELEGRRRYHRVLGADVGVAEAALQRV